MLPLRPELACVEDQHGSVEVPTPQYRMLADAEDLRSMWDRIGGETTAAFRRVEACANSHSDSGQVT
jgi:hypothetical protein